MREVRLSARERAVWALFVARETRRDAVGLRARQILSQTLARCGESGPWCGCPSHLEALALVLSHVWTTDRHTW